MGIDSGLPDFRGPGGFWKVYPALGWPSLRFEEIASPAAFKSRPTLAWGFYGHRLNLYRTTHPHGGFRMLKEICSQHAPRWLCLSPATSMPNFRRQDSANQK
jgi:NAD-dependent SIR2 family protein deacetylase